MKDIVIIGAGGFGREVAWLIERINSSKKEWNILGFIDDTEDLQGKTVYNYPVIGTVDWLVNQDNDIYVVCSVANTKVRKFIIDKLQEKKFATLIDPATNICSTTEIGEGTIICAGVTITTNIVIGRHVIINLHCTIGHDAQLYDFVTLYPSVNVSGFCVIKDYVEMGTGSQIIQQTAVNENTVIGAGAVVVKDIEPNVVAVGAPARAIKKR